MSAVVDLIERNTGHQFTKQVAKVGSNPVEILEEQAVFMKEFQSETGRQRTLQESKSKTSLVLFFSPGKLPTNDTCQPVFWAAFGGRAYSPKLDS
jgi:hypothetical protein